MERVAWYLQCPGGNEESRDSIFVPWQWSSLNTCPSSAFQLWLLDMVGKIVPRHKRAGHIFSVSLHGMSGASSTSGGKTTGEATQWDCRRKVVPPRSPPMDFPIGTGEGFPIPTSEIWKIIKSLLWGQSSQKPANQTSSKCSSQSSCLSCSGIEDYKEHHLGPIKGTAGREYRVNPDSLKAQSAQDTSVLQSI